MLLGAECTVITLAQERQHALAEFGQLGLRSLAPKEIAAKLAFELLDRARERGLGNMAFFRGAREIQRLGDREKIADLMHFHCWPAARKPEHSHNLAADRRP